MFTRLLIAFGIIGIAAYLTTMVYIFADTSWTILGGFLTILILVIAAAFRLPVLLSPMILVGLTNFHGLHPFISLALLIPLFALSSVIVKGILIGLIMDFYRNKAHLENRPSIKF